MAARSQTVLVVEDEEDARNTLMQILEYEGLAVVGSANGKEALDYLSSGEQPCLIIMDIRMPIMDGTEFRTALLDDPRLVKIPVIVVTAMDPSAAAGLSALRVMRKPVDIEALLTVIRQNC
jgi:CheY-like chemotaxis protein